MHCRGPKPTAPLAMLAAGTGPSGRSEPPTLRQPGCASGSPAPPWLGTNASGNACRPVGEGRAPRTGLGLSGLLARSGLALVQTRAEGESGPARSTLDSAGRSSSRVSCSALRPRPSATEGSCGPLRLTLLSPPLRKPQLPWSSGPSCSWDTPASSTHCHLGQGVAVAGAQTSEPQGPASPPGQLCTPSVRRRTQGKQPAAGPAAGPTAGPAHRRQLGPGPRAASLEPSSARKATDTPRTLCPPKTTPAHRSHKHGLLSKARWSPAPAPPSWTPALCPLPQSPASNPVLCQRCRSPSERPAWPSCPALHISCIPSPQSWDTASPLHLAQVTLSSSPEVLCRPRSQSQS